jgi:hypothetical protein
MVPSPLILSWIMDNQKVKSRRTRGILGVTIVGVITLASIGGLLGWILREGVDRNKTPPAVDWTDPSAHAFIFLYLCFGIIDACFQVIVQWTLGSLSNDPAVCARYAGAYRGTVSLGMCIAFTLDSKAVSYTAQVIMQLSVYTLALVSVYYVILRYVKQTNYFTEESVIVPAAIEEIAILSSTVPEKVVEHEHGKEQLANQIIIGSEEDAKMAV